MSKRRKVRREVQASWDRLRALDPDSDEFDTEAATLLMVMTDGEFLEFMRGMLAEFPRKKREGGDGE